MTCDCLGLFPIRAIHTTGQCARWEPWQALAASKLIWPCPPLKEQENHPFKMMDSLSYKYTGNCRAVR